MHAWDTQLAMGGVIPFGVAATGNPQTGSRELACLC